jgi:hypothetical protein
MLNIRSDYSHILYVPSTFNYPFSACRFSVEDDEDMSFNAIIDRMCTQAVSSAYGAAEIEADVCDEDISS